MNHFITGSITGLLQAYRSGKVSPVEICRELVQRIAKHDVRIKAFLRLDPEGVIHDAEVALKDLEKPLAGVPIAVKDVISTAGIETTCSSRILKGYVPPFDATVIKRLRDAGAIILGKTNCDEFAMGSSTENSAFQVTANPWNLKYSPGGSSGGSAAAVTSCFAFGALGSDTGGSVRQPASFCGNVGMKPTYGRVSRYGLVAFGSSLDCIGTLTRSVEDAALMLSVIAGHDAKDSTSSRARVPDYVAELTTGPRLRVGVPKEYFAKGIDHEVAAKIESALQWLQKSGRVELKEISLPHTEYAIASYYVVATAEASSNLSRFDGVRYGLRSEEATSLSDLYECTRSTGFGPEVKRRLMLGTFALSTGYYDAYYLRASRVRTLIARDFENAFGEVDLICTPTAPTAAFPLGEKVDDPLEMYLSDIYTVTMSLAGLPAISIPCGFSSNGLPIGLQVVANSFQESRIFALSAYYLREHPVLLPENI